MSRTWAVGPNEGKQDPIVESAFRKALAQALYNKIKHRSRLELSSTPLNLAGTGEQLAQMTFFQSLGVKCKPKGAQHDTKQR